jgi:diaminopropionate ammonia-lyase
MLILNPRVTRTAYPTELAEIMNTTRAHESRQWLSRWPLIASHATPLYEMPDKAQQLNVARLSLKDESERSSLGSFKALGAPIALVRQLLRLHPEFEPLGVLAGRYRDELKNYTVISATDGNHGRGLAAAARDAGCNCFIVLHAQVSAEREQPIAALGANIVRISGNYDESVQEAARLASENGWQVVSDTSYEGYEEIPRDVMQGYGAIAEEIVEQTGSKADEASPFTHVFLQGGVGGMAAGLASYFWEYHGVYRPRFIVVEPEQADCLLQSALQGRAAKATGSVDSVMAGLACGETSPLAWRFLQPCVEAFMTIQDDQAVQAMRWLALGSANDVPIVAGESAVAGLAALQVLRSDSELSGQVGLNEQSRVLIISTEGATAPAAYAELVSESAESILLRQKDWLSTHVKAVFEGEIPCM